MTADTEAMEVVYDPVKEKHVYDAVRPQAERMAAEVVARQASSTEAMEAARSVDQDDATASTALERQLARALLQQRESIIEECAKVADDLTCVDILQVGDNPHFERRRNGYYYEIAAAIRALAARKEIQGE